MYFDIDKLNENKKEYKMTAAKRQYKTKKKQCKGRDIRVVLLDCSNFTRNTANKTGEYCF